MASMKKITWSPILVLEIPSKDTNQFSVDIEKMYNLLLYLVLIPTFGFVLSQPLNNGNCLASLNLTSTKGQACKFPFKLDGKEYNSCTTDKDPDKRHWCSTKTDSFGVHIRGHWGYCLSGCFEQR